MCEVRKRRSFCVADRSNVEGGDRVGCSQENDGINDSDVKDEPITIHGRKKLKATQVHVCSQVKVLGSKSITC